MLYKFDLKSWDSDRLLRKYASMHGFSEDSVLILEKDKHSSDLKGKSKTQLSMYVYFRPCEVYMFNTALSFDDWL